MPPDDLHNGPLLRTLDDRRIVLRRGARERYIYGDNAAARVARLLHRVSFNHLCTRARRAPTGRNRFMYWLPEAAYPLPAGTDACPPFTTMRMAP